MDSINLIEINDLNDRIFDEYQFSKEDKKKLAKTLRKNDSCCPIRKRDKDPYEMLEEFVQYQEEVFEKWKEMGLLSFKSFDKQEGTVEWCDDAIYDENKQRYIITNCLHQYPEVKKRYAYLF